MLEYSIIQTRGFTNVAEDGRVTGVLDLDSPRRARFDAADQAGCEALVAAFLGR